MMASRMMKDARTILHATSLWIVGTKVESSNPRQRNRLRAHRARFQCDIEIAPFEPFISKDLTSDPDRQHLRVGGRILHLQYAIARLGQDFAVGRDDDSTNRNLTALASFSCRLKGSFHKLICLDHGLEQHMLLV